MTKLMFNNCYFGGYTFELNWKNRERNGQSLLILYNEVSFQFLFNYISNFVDLILNKIKMFL
jgi:hypothetical protein